MTKTTPGADPLDLAPFDTRQLMFELLRRANVALEKQQNAEGERLLRAVLAYVPGHGMILQVLAEIALARDDWAEAVDCARRSIAMNIPTNVFIRSCAIFCCAMWKMEGVDGVRPTFAKVRKKLMAALDASPDLSAGELNFAVTAGLCAGDQDFSHKYFMRRFAEFLPPDVETGISRVVSTQAWCAANGAPFTALDPPRRITSQGMPKKHGTWDYKTLGVNVAIIPGGEMLSGLDFVFTPTGEMLHDSGHVIVSTGTGWYPRVHGDPTNLVMHLWAKDVTEIDEPALFLSCSQCFHVGHWIVDFMPRLRGLSLRPDLKVAIPTETPQKHRDFLRLFGIDDSRIINCDLRRRYRFRELMVVQTGQPMKPEMNNVCFVAEAFRTMPRPSTASRRIFLERDMENRAVANRTEFDAELDRLNFERLNLATLSVSAQRAALSAAEVVIAPYGSELLAFYMMNEGATIIELSWGTVSNGMGMDATCSMTGVKFYVLDCAVAETSERQRYKKDHDFIVDIAALRRTLTDAGIVMPSPA